MRCYLFSSAFHSVFMTVAVAATTVALSPAAFAAAIVNDPGFTTSTLPGNDDGSTGLINTGFATNFYGNTFSQLYVNNNGNVTFNAPLARYTPFGLTTNIGTPIIAAFFGDVDTRNAGSGLTQYGNGLFNGRNAFGVNYINVGYFPTAADKLNSFQLLLVDRSDVTSGDFDIVFNYDKIQWETGSASGGNSGLGGNSARVGYSNGTGATGTNFELTGSGVNGAFLDGGPNALISNSLNSNVAGRYIFNVRNGEVVVVPEPSSVLGLFAFGLTGGSAFVARRRKLKVKS
jgi:Nidogen-like/PEP-CTERM motif